MPNELLTIQMVTREAARILTNNLKAAGFVNRDYEDQFARSGAKIGSVVNARMPVKYTLRRGQQLQPQASIEPSVPVAIEFQTGVDLQFSSAELVLDIDDYSKRFIQPAIATVVNDVDYQVLQMYKDVYNTVGTPGVTPNTNLTYLEAGALLDKTATPRDGRRHMILGEDQMPAIVNANQTLFNDPNKIGKQYRTGMFGTDTLGWDTWSMDQNVARHTVGPLGGAPIVGAANQTGSTLAVTGFSASAALRLNWGDTFTLGGVYGVNPQSRQSTGKLQQFVVLADTFSAADGTATIPIAPPIITAGPQQTVTQSPAAGMALTVNGAAGTQSVIGLGFHEDAFTLVMVDLELPQGVWMADRVSDKQLGVSLRIVKAYDIQNDSQPARLDILWGRKAVRPELAVRVGG
jgi:P22 coat protein - gene protein 5